MSASLRTRDGSFSVVAMEQAAEDAQLGLAEVDAATAVAWAREHGVELIPGEGGANQLARINAKRREYGLPLFVVPAAKAPRPVVVKTAAIPVTRESRAASAPPAPTALPADRAAASTSSRILAAGADELLELVTTFSGTRTGQVTPLVADGLLQLNTGNRPMKPEQVRRFCEILRSGTWINTGEPVIVSREGVLNDGQHRLAAIRDTGIAAEMDIRFGIAREAFTATGTGTRRTAADVLSISGFTYGAAVSAIARLVHHYDAGTMGMCNRAAEGAAILRVVQSNPTITAVNDLVRRTKFAPAKTAPFAAMLAIAARQVPMDRVTEFYRLVESGLVDDESNAARRLHVRLRDAAMARERLRPIESAVLTIRAWNAWLAGRPVHLLKVTEADRTSDGFPKVAAA